MGEFGTLSAWPVALSSHGARSDDHHVGQGSEQAEHVLVRWASEGLGAVVRRNRTIERGHHVGSQQPAGRVGVEGRDLINVEAIRQLWEQRTHWLIVACLVLRWEIMSEIPRLVDRFPRPNRRQLLASLVPPPRFAAVAFGTYQPDSGQPSQAAAVMALSSFASRWCQPAARRLWWRRAPPPPEYRCGVYLDGPFGVGKTHLLASLWHEVGEPKVFCSFAELTHVVGALGFNEVVEGLADSRLLCIDAFELDDRSDTELISALLLQLTQRGVSIAATSSELPAGLGANRFDADNFLAEIQGLATHFDVFRIDGDDYRRHSLSSEARPHSNAELEQTAAAESGYVLDEFGALMAHLATLDPSCYGALVQNVSGLCLRGVHTIDDPQVALPFVVLVDRLYDRCAPVMASGTPLDQVFVDELLRSGYRKKYLRAIFRLSELAGNRAMC
jgi:cell division protein ZapE